MHLTGLQSIISVKRERRAPQRRLDVMTIFKPLAWLRYLHEQPGPSQGLQDRLAEGTKPLPALSKTAYPDMLERLMAGYDLELDKLLDRI